VAGRRKGVKGSKRHSGREKVKTTAGVLGEEERTAYKDTIVFFFFVHQMNVKILIGQILWITQSVVLIGQRPVVQERRSSQFHSFNIVDNSSNRFELFVEETLRSLEENGIKSVSFELMKRQKSNRLNGSLLRRFGILNYTGLRPDKAHCTKVDNGSRLLFKRFCSRKQLTERGCSPLDSLNSSCSPYIHLPPGV